VPTYRLIAEPAIKPDEQAPKAGAH